MQRFIFLTCLTAFVMTSPAFAQRMEDVVHLKNGGLVRGIIIEQTPGESLKIQTRDGNVLVYTMDEIAKMSKEPVMEMGRHIGAKKKNPWIAGGLSLLIPGVGQAYNDQVKKGLTYFGVVIIGIGFMYAANEDDYRNFRGHTVDPDDDNFIGVAGSICFSLSYVGSVGDAYSSAKKINEQNQQSSHGHLIELRGSQATLGVDPVVSYKNLGTRLTLHF